MSHITRIKTQMLDENYLLAALKDAGYSADKGNVDTKGGIIKIRTGLGRPNITFRKTGGPYTLSYDTMFDISSRMGDAFLKQLTQRYAYHAAVSKLLEQGYSLVSEEVQEDDRIHLVMRRVG